MIRAIRLLSWLGVLLPILLLLRILRRIWLLWVWLLLWIGRLVRILRRLRILRLRWLRGILWILPRRGIGRGRLELRATICAEGAGQGQLSMT